MDLASSATYIRRDVRRFHAGRIEEGFMNAPIIQLLVLAGIAIFLIIRLRSVLGTREGFEKPPIPKDAVDRLERRRDFEVIEGGTDYDIADNVPEGSDMAEPLAAMKRVDPAFNVGEFLQGARQAYEMILMAFERGEMADILPLLSQDVYEALSTVVDQREAEGLTIEAEFVGVRDIALTDVEFDEATNEANLTVKFTGELTYQVRDRGGDVIEGNANEIKRQKDVWTFQRVMGTDDPNWKLVATDE